MNKRFESIRALLLHCATHPKAMSLVALSKSSGNARQMAADIIRTIPALEHELPHTLLVVRQSGDDFKQRLEINVNDGWKLIHTAEIVVQRIDHTEHARGYAPSAIFADTLVGPSITEILHTLLGRVPGGEKRVSLWDQLTEQRAENLRRSEGDSD